MMSKNTVNRPAFLPWELFIPLIATSLCILIAAYNKGANDYHLEVSYLLDKIFRSSTIDPEIYTCFQCYHSRLFHYTVSLILKLSEFNPHELAKYANFINVFCWFFTNLILSSLIRWQFMPGIQRLSLLSFCWLNPSTMTVATQATNDAFVMLFGSIALYFITFSKNRQNEIPILAATLLAVFSKGNGFILSSVLYFRSALATFLNRQNSMAFGTACSFALIIALTLLPFLLPLKASPYGNIVNKTVSSKNLDGFNYRAAPMLPLYKDTSECADRPEFICSVLDGFFTFRIFSLIETPKVPKIDNPVLPSHLRSMWTAVYARYFLPVFPQHFWRDESQFMDRLSSILAVLGLLPLYILLSGMVNAFRFNPFNPASWRSFTEGSPFFHLTVVSSMAAMLTIMNVAYQWYPGFKDIYLFAGIFSFWFLFLKGYKLFIYRFKPYRRILAFILLTISLLWFAGMVKVFYTCV